jgi:hypothetical protein
MFLNLEKSKERYEICKMCEEFSSVKTCKSCGCFMPAKVTIIRSRCPLGKWGASDSTDKSNLTDKKPSLKGY